MTSVACIWSSTVSLTGTCIVGGLPVRAVAAGRRDPEDGDALAGVLRRAAVLPADALGGVHELPLPLVGDDADPDRRVLLAGVDRVERLPRDDEEGEDDGDGDRRPDDLELVAAVDLGRQLVVAAPAAVAQDGVEDQPLDEDEDRDPDEEDDVVDVPDRLALAGRGVGGERGADVEVRAARHEESPSAAQQHEHRAALRSLPGERHQPPSTVHAVVLRPGGRSSPRLLRRRDAADESARMIPEPVQSCAYVRRGCRVRNSRHGARRARMAPCCAFVRPSGRSAALLAGVPGVAAGRDPVWPSRRPSPTAARCRRRPTWRRSSSAGRSTPRSCCRSSRRPPPTCGPSAGSTPPTRPTPCPSTDRSSSSSGWRASPSRSCPGSSATTPSSSRSTWSSTCCSSSGRLRRSSSRRRSRSSCGSPRRRSATAGSCPCSARASSR